MPRGRADGKEGQGLARSWEIKKVRTTCPYCGVGCQLWLHMKGSQIVKVTGVEGARPIRAASASRAVSVTTLFTLRNV